MYERRPQDVSTWLMAAGVAVGTSAVSLLVMRRLRRHGPPPPTPVDSLEDAAVELLRRDPLTSGCAIDVAATASGMIELTGVVPTHEVAQRAARLLHALPGVRTVVNRLDTGSLEQHLAANRGRRARGEPVSQERQWYGVRVGMGRRRQSPATDPDRNDDTVERISRDLEVSAADIADGLSVDAGDGPVERES